MMSHQKKDRGHETHRSSKQATQDGGKESDEPTTSKYEGVLHSKKDKALILALKHIDTFYKPPPGLEPGVVEERPEDCIPDRPENSEARDFLARAPTKGLWMPLGKEVKVMQCWRCKAYGHRSGDKECPMFLSGNREMEQFRFAQEDPMASYLSDNRKEKEEKVKQLMKLVNETTTDESSSEDAEKSSKGSRRKKKSKEDEKVKQLMKLVNETTTDSSSDSSDDSARGSKKRKKKRKKEKSKKEKSKKKKRTSRH
ncbi:Retinitis pigmentosa 9 -like protein [Halotydeus destructor]|nr:Retinitis pigmentosa 9 -like protein [Halotydeus destructor]